MGLDAFAAVIDRKNIIKKKEYEVVIEDYRYGEVTYWRKHPNLQGWMERLYRTKGGIETFNGIFLPLNKEDIEQLHRDIINKNLPSTNGFFFGSDSDEYYHEQDLNFIFMAYTILEDNDRILAYYSSW